MSEEITKKDLMLVEAGYTVRQANILRNSISGETDEELTKAIEGLKVVFPPIKVEPVDGAELGKSLYKRLKAKGKI